MDTPTQSFEPPAPKRRRWPLRASAGLLVVVLLLAVVGVITAAVLLNHRSGTAAAESTTTIADLRADPEGWNDKDVVLKGTFEDVRAIPYLDQYALYTFRDDTGSMRVLSRNGAPAGDAGSRIELHAVFHSKVKLNEAIETLVKQRLGDLAGSLVGSVMPDVPLDVVFLDHTSYNTTN